MKYCSNCSKPVVQKIPEGDNRLRFVCEHCDSIFYENPKIVVGCLPIWQEKVLLCKRAIEPRKGFWTLPAGFMENGETTAHGAARETQEEACAEVNISSLYRLYDLPYINQVYMFYLANMVTPEFAAGDESLDVGLYDENDIPWDDLAFPVIADVLKDYFAERIDGNFTTKITEPPFPKFS